MRKYDYFPWPLLHTWAVSSRVRTRGQADGSISAGLCWRALLLGQAAARSWLEPSLKCAQQHPASTGAEARLQASPPALCWHLPHLPTPVPARTAARGTGSSPQPHSAWMLEPPRAVLQGNTAQGQGKKRGSNQLQITPAYCTFPGVNNNSTYKLSCFRAPPACLQKARFSGRRGWGQIITFNLKVQIWRAYFWKDKSTCLTVSRRTEHVILSHPDRVELRRPAMKRVWITASSFFEYLIRSFYILQSIAIRYNLVGKH